MRNLIAVVVLLASVAVWAVAEEPDAAPPAEPAKAVTVTVSTSDGKGADTYVHSRKPDDNQGASKGIAIMTQSDAVRIGYVRFDLSGMTDPVKGAVLSLSLVPNTGKGFHVLKIYGLNDGDEDNWLEGTGGAAPAKPAKAAAAPAANEPPATQPAADGITFKTAPAIEKRGVDAKKATLLGVMVIDNTDYRMTKKSIPAEFGSQELLDWLGKDTNKLATFIIVRQDVSQDAIVTIGTKEGQKAPKLKLSSEPLPIPVQPALPEPTPATKPAAAPAE